MTIVEVAASPMVLAAKAFATKAHEGQVRKYDGKPYITHPTRVVLSVALHHKSTDEMICAAWLHDVVEDCGVSLETIRDKFGPVVAQIVEELTNTSKKEFPNLNRAGRKHRDREKLKVACPEAKVLKMLDRIDNLRDMAKSGDAEFLKVYLEESNLLINAVGDADHELAKDLLAVVIELEEAK